MIIFVGSSRLDCGWMSTGYEIDPIVLPRYDRDTRMKEIVDAIYDAWADGDEGDDIDCLYLFGHGNAGVLWLGTPSIGVGGAAYFTKLRGCFTAGGRGIELHGCACASSTDISNWNGKGTPSASGKGYQMMKQLAINTGTKVTGSIDSVSGINAAWSYAGVRTMTVQPFGYGVASFKGV